MVAGVCSVLRNIRMLPATRPGTRRGWPRPPLAHDRGDIAMRQLVLQMQITVDGFVAGPNGKARLGLQDPG